MKDTTGRFSIKVLKGLNTFKAYFACVLIGVLTNNFQLSPLLWFMIRESVIRFILSRSILYLIFVDQGYTHELLIFTELQ